MVPNRWEEVKLIDTSAKEKHSFTGGPFGSNLKSSDYTETGVRIIQLQNIGDGKFLNDYKIFTSEDKANELISCNIYPGDIILSKMGDPVARATIIPDYHDRYLMASDGIRLKINEEKFDTFFIHEVINAPHFRRMALAKSTGSTRRRIGLTDLRNITFYCPPLPEQQKIAKILTTWDKSINTTERLIENSKQQKKALMQQLLTGQKRLLDDSGQRFSGDWEEVDIGSTSKTFSGGTPSRNRPEYYGGNIPWITSGKINDRFVNSVNEYISESGLDNSSAKVVKKGSILIAMYGATAGKVAVNMLEGATINQAVLALEPKDKFNKLFLFYLLEMVMQKALHLVQGGQPNLSATIIKSVKIKTPSVQEQQKIAAVLTNADREIEVLEQQLADLQQEKKALMQQLLTGKKRVKVD